jgi:hypothetical protein
MSLIVVVLLKRFEIYFLLVWLLSLLSMILSSIEMTLSSPH